jgi:hypothetical protein
VKYRELRERLNAMPDDHLDFTVTAYMRTPEGEVMFPIVALRLTDAELIGSSHRSLKLTGEDYPRLIGNRALMA